jgi:hypothetical protein
MTAEEEDRVSEVPERTDIEKKLEAGAWGLFFVWVGVAWWAGLSWGVRRAYKLSVEPFWIVVGLCFAVGGIWEFLETDTSAVPIVLILVGGALLLMLFKRRGR